MKKDKIEIECDVCSDKILLDNKQPLPSNWFSIGGRHNIYGDVCSIECLEELIDKRKDEISSKLYSILDDYNEANK